MDVRLSTGTECFDELLNGGLEKDVITTIYGPAGAGKTNLSLVIIASVIQSGKKVLYIDTEGSFSIARMLQILPDYEKYAKNILFLKPYTFDDQKQAFLKLQRRVEEDAKEFSLIVVDSIAMLYRLEIGKTLDVQFVNKELGIQLGLLTEIARRYSIPVLLVNQVYADFDNRDRVNMVGGDLLKYQSKCLIEFKKGHNGIRVAKLIKHRSLPEGLEMAFKIIESGVQKTQIPTIADKVNDEFV